MRVNPVEVEGFIPRAVNEAVNASVRKEMPQSETKGPVLSPMPVSDTIEPKAALSVYLGQSYQKQQAYFDTARRMEIGAVGEQGMLPPPYEVTILRATQTLIRMKEDGWNGVLPYNPYIYHNFMWKQPQEHISIVW